jgi:LCP family protein required for cell wall assembly
MPDEAPPKVGVGLLKRAAVAAALIVFMTAGAVSAAGLLTADDFINQIEEAGHGRAPIPIPEDEIDRADAGEAQTIMILGSDERFDDRKQGVRPRSDTIILVRLDPDAGAIALMSIPRDLKVTVPGYQYQDKINSAYENGGPRLTLKTVKALFENATGEPFEVNHIVNINFGGFRRAIDYIGCVYVDIDRRYFNDRGGPGGYATIDVQPGYQKMCGSNALDYVRYRHGDNDLVRAARQQDFLRQLKAQAGIREVLKWSERGEIAKLVGRYTETDKGLRRKKEVFSLLKLVLFTAKNPIREVRFRIDPTDDLVYLNASNETLAKTAREFLNARASSRPRATPQATDEDRDTQRERRKRGNKASSIPGLEIARREGEDQAVLGAPKIRFPFYFPTLRTSLAAYAAPEPRVYTIRDELGERHRAYRLVVHKGMIGEYYGIQGTSWKDPPILDDPSEVREVDGRELELHYDGRRLRLVAWRTRHASYWVTNTLTQSLSTKQMLGIAASLRRLGQK